MSDISKIYYTKMPNTLYQMSRILTKHLIIKKDLIIPNITAEKCDVKVCQKKLNRYRKIFNYPSNVYYLPPLYPHILAFPLHMELLLHPKFPRTPIGSVHLRNSIKQFRPIAAHEKLDIRVNFSNSVSTRHGLEFDIETRFYAQGELTWSSESTILLRQNTENISKSTSKNNKNIESEFSESSHLNILELPKNWGIQYGLASGDLNPIHLNPWLAKFFGFKNHIAHGMAGAASIFSILNEALQLESFCYDLEFKHPIPLPNSVNLYHRKNPDQESLSFAAFTSSTVAPSHGSPKDSRPKIVGNIQKLG